MASQLEKTFRQASNRLLMNFPFWAPEVFKEKWDEWVEQTVQELEDAASEYTHE